MRLGRHGGLIAAAAVAVVLGGYAGFWFLVAGRIENGIGEWAESLRPHHLDLSWQAIRVDGFPFGFRAELREARLRDPALGEAAEVRVPRVSAAARPWNFRRWRLAAPDGLSAALGPGARLTARQANGTVDARADGGAAIRLVLDDAVVEAGLRTAAEQAELSLALPPHPPQTAEDEAVAVTLALRQVAVPAAPPPLRNPLDEITLKAAVKGPVPAAPPRQAAAAWRDAGGTVEVGPAAVRWGTLALTGSGTLALDAELQPIGSFSVSIQGYDQLLSALVAAGRMRPADAGVARLALGFLAAPGPDRRPQISAPFTMQDGQMFLGPARLGPAPRIPWQ